MRAVDSFQYVNGVPRGFAAGIGRVFAGKNTVGKITAAHDSRDQLCQKPLGIDVPSGNRQPFRRSELRRKKKIVRMKKRGPDLVRNPCGESTLAGAGISLDCNQTGLAVFFAFCRFFKKQRLSLGKSKRHSSSTSSRNIL